MKNVIVLCCCMFIIGCGKIEEKCYNIVKAEECVPDVIENGENRIKRIERWIKNQDSKPPSAYICHDCKKTFNIYDLEETHDPKDYSDGHILDHYFRHVPMFYRCEKCNDKLLAREMKTRKTADAVKDIWRDDR